MFNIFRSTYPSLDLHGEEPALIFAMIDSFIKDNIILKQEYIVIIHGKGTYAVRNETHYILKNHKKVKEFYINQDNTGETIIRLKI